MASALVDAYENLLVDNISTVNTVESTIRNVTWFLPGRFADADVASEGLYTLLSLVSSAHDALLDRRIPQSLSLPPHPFAPEPPKAPESLFSAPAPTSRVQPVLPPATEHRRYTRYFTKKSPAYRRASRALQTVTYIELLLEMLIRRKLGDKARWRLVLSIETFKTFLRFIILAVTRRPVLSPTTPQREFDPSMIPQDKLSKKNDVPAAPTAKAAESRPVIPELGTRAPLRAHLYQLVTSLPEAYQTHPLGLVPELCTAKEWLSEILNSTSPLVQVLLFYHATRNPKSKYKPYSLPTLSTYFYPFLVPLAMQLLARNFRAPTGDSTLLAEHYAKLDRRLATRFFLTGPMWVGWTRPKVMSVVRGLQRIPLIGLAGGLIEGYLPLVDDYYYTASG